ncbi:MAG TPA: hypothetical protein VF756_07565 [Thermoanaerobaculia bacterium]
MNRRILFYCVLGALACYGSDNTRTDSNSTVSEHTASENMVSDLPQFKSIADGIRSAATADLYEGLPHQLFEHDAFNNELATKKIVQLHGFLFYEHPLAIGAEDVERLRQLSAAPESYRRYGGPKPCGGFHPDYALVWKDGERTYDLLVCFGCEEVQLHGLQQELMVEIASGEFSTILGKYRSQRP